MTSRFLVGAAASLLLGFVGGGCVAQATYDALRMENQTLKTQLQQTQGQAGADRMAMGNQLSATQSQCMAVAQERDALRQRMGEEQHRLHEVRSRIESMMPILQYVLSAMTPPVAPATNYSGSPGAYPGSPASSYTPMRF